MPNSILHICLSKGWGGLEMYPIRIGQRLKDRGYNVYGLCVKGTPVAKGMREAGIETFEIESKTTLVANQIFALNSWLKERSVTIIHSHKSGDILVSALLHMLIPRSSFFTEHMGSSSTKKDIYHKLLYRHLKRIFSISDATYKRNLAALPITEDRLSRLWLGTDISENLISDENDISNIKKEVGLDISGPIIGNIGRMCDGKGQLELIDAFSIIKRSNTTSQLILVGGLKENEGADIEYVEQLTQRVDQLGLQDSVHFLGFRTDTDRMLAIMDVVCLPNRNEAFGLTAIEAMAAKKAIVAADTGALPEILSNTALLAPPDQPDLIAIQIERYANDEALRKENAKKAYLRAHTEFSMDAHLDKLTQFYSTE
ncbi:glycosyltransferase family 4 protein [Vibrio rhodolitus]|uniref:glycosyltransferase family 4 protein n=1 Tax=Vibrio rhodolitus TaxID=2231649 RepID=UPI001FC9C156|nr:glycosyltransferase family 4 protein [Vibrio rhodolitus]